MPALKLRRIDCTTGDTDKQLKDLREQFSSQGLVVSHASRKLTQTVFGEALPPAKAVARICEDVKKRGLSAVLHYTEQFDKVRLTPKMVRVPLDQMAAAFKAAEPDFIETIRRCRNNVMQFQIGLLNNDAILTVSEHYELQLRFRPLNRVGICIPGGAAAYPSTLLMTVCPAQAAGVKEIAVVMPPTANGAENADMLAVCHALGVKEVYRIGGAQAVAALAYGTDETPAVDIIVGPGNQFVALAKQYVQGQGQVAIDCIAGPSEIVVVADDSAVAEFIACDLIAQAEHSPGVAMLVTWVPELIDDVEVELNKQLAKLSRGELAHASLADFGAAILVKDAEEAAIAVNLLATEHLHVQVRDPEAFADKINNAGAIFLGQFTPVALGDYAAGPSHVLPTGGQARFASGLNANDFRRRTSVMSYTRNGLRDIADDVIYLANKEGLSGHAASIELRLRDLIPTPRPPKKVPPKPALPAKK